MMMSDIPQDLIEEILSRVPAASLKRLRSTCKLWNDLFKDGRFGEKHIRKAPKQSRTLMLNDHKICSLNVNLNVTPAVEFKGPLGLKDSHSCSQQVDIDNVFHCDGLLLCTIRNDRHRLMVWNPFLGETRWIQTCTTDSNSRWRYSFALGYQNNKFCRSYKILKCWNSIVRNRMAFEVYELSSDSWRVFDDIALDRCILPKYGVSLKGNAYWLAFGQKNGILLGFDFTRDVFIRLCLPQATNIWDVNLSVVREEQLALLHCPQHTPYMEVWVAHEIDTQAALWSKSFTVELHNPDHFSLCFDSFVIDEEKKVVLCCKDLAEELYIFGEDNVYCTKAPSVCRDFTVPLSICADSAEVLYFLEEGTESRHRKSSLPFIFSYVPSLVQIQQRLEQ